LKNCAENSAVGILDVKGGMTDPEINLLACQVVAANFDRRMVALIGAAASLTINLLVITGESGFPKGYTLMI